jgi:hypothetical protein
MILLANDTDNGIEHESDFRSGSQQGDTTALDRLDKPLDPLRGNSLPCEIIPDCTPCFIRQQYHYPVKSSERLAKKSSAIRTCHRAPSDSHRAACENRACISDQETKPRPTPTQAPQEGLSKGLRGVTDFYKAHGVSETTARRGLEGKYFPVVQGEWQRGNAIIKQAPLDLSGQRAFCEYYAGKRKLHECLDAACVCHQVIGQ